MRQPLRSPKPLTPARRRGYFLMEMMFVIGLMGLFLLAAGRLFYQTMRVSIESRRREEVARRFDLAMDHLRADVWGADRIEAGPAGGHTVALRRPGGATVIWRVEPERVDETASFEARPPTIRLVRTDSSVNDPLPGRWDDLPAGVSFEADGAVLRVRAPAAREGGLTGHPGPTTRTGTAGTRLDELTLVSQYALAGRAP